MLHKHTFFRLLLAFTGCVGLGIFASISSAVQSYALSNQIAQQPGEPVSTSCTAIGAHVPRTCWDNVIWQEVGRLPAEWPMAGSENVISLGQNTVVKRGNSVTYDQHSTHDGYVRLSGNCSQMATSIIRSADSIGGYSTNFGAWYSVPSTLIINGRQHQNPRWIALERACSQ